jgi:hypothetical protein
MGRLIPAGTGFELYRSVQIPADEPPPQCRPASRQLAKPVTRAAGPLRATAEGLDAGERPGRPRRRQQAPIGDAVDLTPLDQQWNQDERDLLAAAAVSAGTTWVEPWGTGQGQTTTHVHADWR